MLIRKEYRFEAAHIVRGCSTDRCRWNIHGHSFRVELFLRSDSLDNAGMVMDFSLLRPWVREVFEAFDHSYLVWDQESEEFKENVRRMSRRWVELPFSPTAENLARFFHWIVQKMLDRTLFANGEACVEVRSVRVHETETGYAETEGREPLVTELDSMPLQSVVFSDEVMSDTKIGEIMSVLSSENGRFGCPEYL